MARKPKASSSPDLSTTEAGDDLVAPGGLLGAKRRGRKPRTAITTPASFSAMEDNGVATESAPANADATGSSDTQRRGRGSRKPKQAAGAAASPLLQGHAKPRRGHPPRQPKTEPEPTGPAAARGSDIARSDAGPAKPASDAALSSINTEISAPSKPAAQWDWATDMVRFDWPEVERVAAQPGPNQAMAKLLLAARTEGEHSRWPF